MASQKILKCIYCGDLFDRDTTPHVKVGNRYAHNGCANSDAIQNASDRTELTNYIVKIFNNSPKIDWKRIGTQIKQYTEQGYTLTGIKFTLQYMYDIRKMDKEKANYGIGLVPYKYNEARQYYVRENNIHTMAHKVKTGSIDKKDLTKNQVLISKKNIDSKKARLLSMDYTEGDE